MALNTQSNSIPKSKTFRNFSGVIYRLCQRKYRRNAQNNENYFKSLVDKALTLYNYFMFIKRLGAFFLDILEVIVFAVAIFLFLYLLVLQPHKIKGASMEPNFPNGEYLLTDKVTYRFGEPKRGDVIVFKAPTGNGDEYIKRIIGLPGEGISVRNGKIYVNNEELKETYIPEISPTYGGNFLAENVSFVV